jgi:uridine phosphorylase
MPADFPAVAHYEVVQALRKAATDKGLAHRVGISQSKDSFYGEVEPEHSGVTQRLLDRWKAWEIGGAICSEMEASALFVIASMLRVRAGGVMMVHAKEPMPPLDILLNTSIDALREIIAFDKANGRAVS